MLPRTNTTKKTSTKWNTLANPWQIFAAVHAALILSCVELGGYGNVPTQQWERIEVVSQHPAPSPLFVRRFLFLFLFLLPRLPFLSHRLLLVG